jgi:hypothetical protein
MKKLLLFIAIFVTTAVYGFAGTTVYDNTKVSTNSTVSCSVIATMGIAVDNSSLTLGPYTVSSSAYPVGQTVNFTISGLAGANFYYRATTSPSGTACTNPCSSFTIPGTNANGGSSSHVTYNVSYPASTNTTGTQATLGTDGSYKVTFTINNVTANSIGTSTIDFTVQAGYGSF